MQQMHRWQIRILLVMLCGGWAWPAEAAETDMVINEIMYNPADENAGGEFVEIYNQGGTTVNVSGWQLEDSAQVMFTLPAGTVIAAGGYLVFYEQEAAIDFYGLDTGISYGPYSGGLSGSGERIALKNVGGTVIDEVTYDDNSPWPTEPDGNGPSLELINPLLDNNAGTSWGTGQPYTPGAANHPIIFVAEPDFLRTSGIFTEGFSLTLTRQSATATIYYTLDGTDPSLSSSAYSAPIPISGSTLVKAAVYEPGVGWSQIRAEGFSKINTDIQNFSSNLPIVVIDSFGEEIIWPQTAPAGSPEYTLVQATFIDVDPATGRAVMSGPADHTGMDGIRIRGHGSAYMPKKNYKLETWNNSFQDKDVSLLGLPAESDWVLYGPFPDKTLIRNLLAYQWSNEIGRYALRTRLVELFVNTDGGDVRMDNLGLVPTYSVTEINYSTTYPYGPDFAYPGDYAGVYVLMEKITRDDNRVDIRKLDTFDNSEPEITGGYLIQHDCCHSGAGDFSCNFGIFLLEDPKPEETTTTQKNWLINYLDGVKGVLDGSAFADPAAGYRQYLDVGSFIDHFWLEETVRNVDAYVVSAFMFKDRLGKLNMGPVWDFDMAFGNANFMSGALTAGWDYEQRGNESVAKIFDRLRQDPEYELALWDRWFSLREHTFRTGKLLDDIEYWAAFLEEAQIRNYQRWPVLGIKLKLNGLGNEYAYSTYQQEIDAMEAWLVARLDWIDSQFSYSPVLFNRDGGEVDSGFMLTMMLPAGKSGTIYYTLDGSDPRQAYTGEAVGTPYTDPVALTSTLTIKARYLNGSTWSAMNEASFIVDPIVVINEFMADNYSTIEDPDEPNEFPDWIELYNKGTTTVDLAGKFLTDDLNDPNKYVIPAGITIDPGEHLLFWADEDGSQGPTHANFQLSQGGEAIGLFDSYANGNLPLSVITFGMQTTDISYGRYPDGVRNWGFMQSPTPGETNRVIENLKSCTEIWEEGYGLIEDINTDCHVDLQDYALMTSDWLAENSQPGLQLWDAAAEFSQAGNPNGVWSYGRYENGDGSGAWVLYDTPAGYQDILINWQTPTTPDTHSNVNKNITGNTFSMSNWGPGCSWRPYQMCVMVPYNWGAHYADRAAVRFTAPIAGTYEIAAAWENRAMNGNASGVFVSINGSEVFTYQVSGFAEFGTPPASAVASFSDAIALAAGETIDVGSWGIAGVYPGGNQVGVEAVISISEPYLICGGAGFVYMPADFNRDCTVNFDDLLYLVNQWLSTNDPSDPNFEPNW